MAVQAQPEIHWPIIHRLGVPRLEMRIAPGDARAYHVAEGECVQVVDLEGKQCSDFLAFNSADVSDEMNLTLTRATCEGLWPDEGQIVYSDQGTALLRIEEDRVKQHDTTLPSCNAAYYVALGCPDHRSCTDNFNRELGPFGVKPRYVWQPFNLFYNVGLSDDRRTFVVEEPLSRPGDYMLMQAMTDLVLASSACRDDLAPTNGWNPTAILVRVYRAPR